MGEIDETQDDSDAFLRAVAAVPDVEPEHTSSSMQLTRIAHFAITRKIGRGGMGIVFEAHDEKLRRTVALKVLPEGFGADERRRKRFMREARTAASITHPNVATVYDIGEADAHIYIAMELVSGVTLRRHLQRARPTVEEARRIAIEISKGVAAAHERGILHRDLKPDNVMVTSEAAIKVLDFGLAKPTDVTSESGERETASLTQDGGILGTPGYMSPEQATGRELDLRSDVFSIGVILYEMLAGKRPFSGITSMDAIIATSRDPHEPLSSADRAIPRALEIVVDRCLEKDPSKRFATAADVAIALDRTARADAPEEPPIAKPKRSVSTRLPWIALGLAIAGGGAWVALPAASPNARPDEKPANTSATTTEVPRATPNASATATPNASATATAVASAVGNASTTAGATASHTAITIARPPNPRVVPATSSTAALPPASATSTASTAASASAPSTNHGGVVSTSPY